MKKQKLAIEQFSGYFLLFCVIGLLLLLYSVMEIFVIDLLFAAILTSVFYPLYRRIYRYTGQRARLSSVLTCVFIVFVILIPLSLFVYQFILEAISAVKKTYTAIQGGALDPILEWKTNGYFAEIRNRLLPFIDINTLDISSWNITASLTETLTTMATAMGKQITEFAKGIVVFLFHFSIMIISMFFFFKDAPVIIKKLMHLSPLPTQHNETIIYKFKEISQATMFGIFLTAMIQGFLGGIGFLIVGISNPIFWGTLMALFALIPVLGTYIVWLPAAIYLISTGHLASGIFLLVWGVTVVSLIDNFLRPYFISGRSRTYPLLTFLSILGGLAAFGLQGIILGPLILTLCFVLISIYEIEYHGVLRLKYKDYPQSSFLKRLFKAVKEKANYKG